MLSNNILIFLINNLLAFHSYSPMHFSSCYRLYLSYVKDIFFFLFHTLSFPFKSWIILCSNVTIFLFCTWIFLFYLSFPFPPHLLLCSPPSQLQCFLDAEKWLHRHGPSLPWLCLGRMGYHIYDINISYNRIIIWARILIIN